MQFGYNENLEIFNGINNGNASAVLKLHSLPGKYHATLDMADLWKRGGSVYRRFCVMVAKLMMTGIG